MFKFLINYYLPLLPKQFVWTKLRETTLNVNLKLSSIPVQFVWVSKKKRSTKEGRLRNKKEIKRLYLRSLQEDV